MGPLLMIAGLALLGGKSKRSRAQRSTAVGAISQTPLGVPVINAPKDNYRGVPIDTLEKCEIIDYYAVWYAVPEQYFHPEDSHDAYFKQYRNYFLGYIETNRNFVEAMGIEPAKSAGQTLIRPVPKVIWSVDDRIDNELNHRVHPLTDVREDEYPFDHSTNLKASTTRYKSPTEAATALASLYPLPYFPLPYQWTDPEDGCLLKLEWVGTWPTSFSFRVKQR